MIATTPQVWIGCLAAYNEGTLHGKWVDAQNCQACYSAGMSTHELLHRLTGLHTERNSLGGRFHTRNPRDGITYRVDRPELKDRLARLTREISELEVEYAGRLSYHSIEGGYTCPRCGCRVAANEGRMSHAYVERDYAAIGCCEDCMDTMLADPDERVAGALVAWKAA